MPAHLLVNLLSPARSELPCCAGLMQTGPLPPGISGVAALNPTMATMMSGNPMMAGMMGGTLMGGATGAPFQEGWLKLRGIPFNVAKSDIIRFFAVEPAWSIEKGTLQGWKVSRL